jgi:hypothetical protein
MMYQPQVNYWQSKRFIGGSPVLSSFEESLLGNNWRKLRIVRVGSNWTSYRYTDAKAWVAVQSNQAIGSGDITLIYLMNNTSVACTINTHFDNFTINSGTVVWPLNIHAPNFQLDDVAGTPVEVAAPSGSWDSDAAATLNIGNTGDEDDGFDGALGELRISRVIRPEAWRSATYKTLIDQLNIYGYHDQRIKMVVDSSLIDSELTNFPLPILLNNTNAPELFAALVYEGKRTDGIFGDSFVGDDGDPYDPDMWEDSDSSTVPPPTILDDKLHIDIAGASQQYTRSMFKVSGDFEVSVSVAEATLTAASNSFRLMCVNKKTGSTQGAYVMFYYNGADDKYGCVFNTGSWGAPTYVSRSSDWGRIKIVRSGSTMQAWYKNGSADYVMLDSEVVGTDDMYIYINGLSGGGVTEGYFGEFWIENYDEIIWPNGTHPNRKKIRVAGLDGVSLNTELEWGDIENALLVLHTKVPVISALRDTDLFVYFDVDAEDTPEVGDTGSDVGKNVWDSDFAAVYHMAQSATEISDADGILDSTGNENHGTAEGSPLPNPLDGLYGKFMSFNYENLNRVNCGSGSVLDDITLLTLEVFTYIYGAGGNDTGRFIAKTADAAPGNDWGMIGDFGAGKSYLLFHSDWISNYGYWHSPVDSIGFTEWLSLAVTYDAGLTTNDPLMYVNGESQLVTQTAAPAGAKETDAANPLYIGGRGSDRNTYGNMNEVRISKVIRSAAWLKATSSAFLNDLLDINYDLSDIPWLGNWAYRKKIKIDSSLIGSDMSNYPLMIRIDGAAGTGDDDLTVIFDEIGLNYKKLAVTLADGRTQLVAEQSRWDDSAEIGILWTVIPEVLADEDTYLWIYYDNAQADNVSYIGVPGDDICKTMWVSTPYIWAVHLTGTMATGDEIRNSVNGDGHSNYGGLTEIVDAHKEAPTGYGIEWAGSGKDRAYVGPGSATATALAALSAACTIETFIYPHTTGEGTWGRVFETDTDLGLYHQGTQLTFKMYPLGDLSNGNITTSGGTGVILNEWNHAFMSWKKTDGIFRPVINGEIVSSGSGPDTGNMAIADIRTDIGNAYRSGAWDRTFDGVIAEVRVSDEGLSEDWAIANNHAYRDELLEYSEAEEYTLRFD